MVMASGWISQLSHGEYLQMEVFSVLRNVVCQQPGSRKLKRPHLKAQLLKHLGSECLSRVNS
jgi:hypothetical protein